MRDQIDCRLTSGDHLRFTLYKEGRPLSPMGGNFLYVKDSPDGEQVIFAGQTDNLAMHAESRWAEAKAGFGVEGLYTRLNITTAVRKREHSDLLEALEPPMNAEDAKPAEQVEPTSDDKGSLADRP